MFITRSAALTGGSQESSSPLQLYAESGRIMQKYRHGSKPARSMQRAKPPYQATLTEEPNVSSLEVKLWKE